MSCSSSCPVWVQTQRSLPAGSPGCPWPGSALSQAQPKAVGPCARRGWRVPLVLPAAPMRSCDNRGHQRPLLVRALPCPGSRGCSRRLRTRGRSSLRTKDSSRLPLASRSPPARPGMLLGALSKHGGAGDGGAGRAHTREDTASISESSLCASCPAGPHSVICTPTEVTELWDLRLICSEMVRVRGWARVSPALQRSSGSLAAA